MTVPGAGCGGVQEHGAAAEGFRTHLGEEGRPASAAETRPRPKDEWTHFIKPLFPVLGKMGLNEMKPCCYLMGVVVQVLFWFETVRGLLGFERFKNSGALHNLAEEFYDYFLVSDAYSFVGEGVP